MRAMAMTVFAVFSLLFSVSTATAEPAKVKTGYEITGCTEYRLDPDTGRVIELCKESPRAFFFDRLTQGDAPGPSSDSDSEGGESK